MKKVLFLIFFIVFLALVIRFFPKTLAQSKSCDISNVQSVCKDGLSSSCNDLLNQCQASINQALQDSINATAPLQSKLDSINNQIKGIKNTIENIEYSLAQKKKDIDQGYKDLAKQQQILNITIRDYYIKSYYNSPLLILLSSNSVSEFTQILGYQKANADRDKAIIETIATSIQELQNASAKLQKQEEDLTLLKTGLDKQSAELDKIVTGAKNYQATLASQLSQLNSIQQRVLSGRLSSLNIPLFAYNTQGGCSSDIGKDPGFSPKFGFFTYGVPNRVGLNQYGAWGRAKSGQNYEQILRAYYNFDSIEKRDATINVEGYGSYSLDEYTKRVYEVPSSWTDNDSAALKAQAIAARSYALAYTNNGSGSICTTQQCQVFKPDPKTDNNNAWINAVDATAGMVMVQGGNPIKAWFSSTHGGYTHSSGDVGWDNTSWTKNAVDSPSSINSFSDLQSNAYDKDSPWFYCDWGSRSSYNETAWLKSDEVADIVNVLLLAQKDSSTVNHLYQTDKPNPAGTDTWDASRVKSELSSRGITPYNSVSAVSISADFGSGKVTSVNISGDGGNVSFSGSDFKNYFNLRAPSNIQIVGPLYNIER